jgi:hypothetical protein
MYAMRKTADSCLEALSLGPNGRTAQTKARERQKV